MITVPNTFIATSEAISQGGGSLTFVDVDPHTYNLDPTKLKLAITKRTKGIVPVHLCGQPADMDPILAVANKYGLWLVEDACQAHLAEYKGRKVGSIGIAGAFSFYPGKNLGACGEGGAITTNDAELARKVRMIIDHGQERKHHHEMEGYNGRCDALQAAALRIKVKFLPAWNEARRRNAQRYFDLIQGTDDIVLPKTEGDSLPVFHLFVIQVDNRDAVREALLREDISTGLHYPIPLHLQKAYTCLGYTAGSFPVAEKCAQRIPSLPVFPELTPEQVHKVSSSLKTILKEF